MALIIYKDGSVEQIDAPKALKLYMIQKDLRPGPKEAHQFLKRVERIEFKAKRFETPDLSGVRLPYND